LSGQSVGGRPWRGVACRFGHVARAWAEAVEICQGEEELAALIEKITLGHPKSLKLITGPEYRVVTASRRGGRGFSGDLILLDELRERDPARKTDRELRIGVRPDP
jgi:hypothetical protein